MTEHPTSRGPQPATAASPLSRRTVLLGAAAVAGAAGAVVAARSLAGPAGDPLDDYDPAAAPYFRRFALGGAYEVERYATLEQMTRSATAVVTARVVDVVATRTIRAEAGDRVGMVGLVLEPTVLAGRLPAAYAGRLTVEFVGGSEPVERTLADLRERVPKATAVWFLRAKAENVARREARARRLGRPLSPAQARVAQQDRRYFRLVSSQGFFLQGSRHVENPVAVDHGDVDPVRRQAEGIDRLSRLAERVRSAR